MYVRGEREITRTGEDCGTDEERWQEVKYASKEM